MPIYGLGEEREKRFAEIEYFVRTGKRADGIRATNHWIEDSLKFVAETLRGTLDDNAQMSFSSEGNTPIVVAARQLFRVLKRIEKDEGPLHSIARQLRGLEEAFQYQQRLDEKHNL